jgi:ribosome-binding factor A
MARRSSSSSAASGPSQRLLRVAELIRHAMAEVLLRGDITDPDLESALITIPEVRLSPDLRLATLYVLAIGGGDTAKAVVALERNKKYLRGEISKRVNLKFSPDIRFRVDDRFDEVQRIEALLHSEAVARDLRKPQSQEDEDEH